MLSFVCAREIVTSMTIVATIWNVFREAKGASPDAAEKLKKVGIIVSEWKRSKIWDTPLRAMEIHHQESTLLSCAKGIAIMM